MKGIGQSSRLLFYVGEGGGISVLQTSLVKSKLGIFRNAIRIIDLTFCTPRMGSGGFEVMVFLSAEKL